MSEFSESYHLRSERREDAAELLRRAKLRGFVFPPVNGWVTFLAEGGEFKPDPHIASCNEGFLLHYFHAEDHGWGFVIFEKTSRACSYECGWDPALQITDYATQSPTLRRLFSDPETLAEARNRLRPKPSEEEECFEAAEWFARAAGLTHYEWLAYHYVARDLARSPESHADVLEVK